MKKYSDSPHRPPKADHGAPSILWTVDAGGPLPGGPTIAPTPEPSTTWSTTGKNGSDGRIGWIGPGMHASGIGTAPMGPAPGAK